MTQKDNTAKQGIVPQTTLPRMLPGRSAYYWYDRGLRLIISVFIAIAAQMMIIYLIPVANPIRFPLMLVVLVIGCIISIIMFIAAFNMAKADRREKKAGYTTTYDYRKKDLWQLDPDTGEVLRKPGEPSY